MWALLVLALGSLATLPIRFLYGITLKPYEDPTRLWIKLTHGRIVKRLITGSVIDSISGDSHRASENFQLRLIYFMLISLSVLPPVFDLLKVTSREREENRSATERLSEPVSQASNEPTIEQQMKQLEDTGNRLSLIRNIDIAIIGLFFCYLIAMFFFYKFMYTCDAVKILIAKSLNGLKLIADPPELRELLIAETTVRNEESLREFAALVGKIAKAHEALAIVSLLVNLYAPKHNALESPPQPLTSTDRAVID